MKNHLPRPYERVTRGLRAQCNPYHEGAFVELLNKEMEELLKSIENNEELKKLYENNSLQSIGDKNETERN